MDSPFRGNVRNLGSRGFMTMGAQILGLVLIGVIYAILLPLLTRWIDSGALVAVVCVLLFVPIFMSSYWLADVLTGFTSREEREEEERQRKARHKERRGRKKRRGRKDL